MVSRNVLYNLRAIAECLCRRGWAKAADMMITLFGEKWGEERVFGFFSGWKLPDHFHDIIKPRTQG